MQRQLSVPVLLYSVIVIDLSLQFPTLTLLSFSWNYRLAWSEMIEGKKEKVWKLMLNWLCSKILTIPRRALPEPNSVLFSLHARTLAQPKIHARTQIYIKDIPKTWTDFLWELILKSVQIVGTSFIYIYASVRVNFFARAQLHYTS